MKDFILEVLTPDKTLFWGRATALTAHAIDGEVQVKSFNFQGIIRDHGTYNSRISNQSTHV